MFRTSGFCDDQTPDDMTPSPRSRVYRQEAGLQMPFVHSDVLELDLINRARVHTTELHCAIWYERTRWMKRRSGLNHVALLCCIPSSGY
jgi:hypothetical protein